MLFQRREKYEEKCLRGSFFIKVALPYTPKDDTQQKLIYREIVAVTLS